MFGIIKIASFSLRKNSEKSIIIKNASVKNTEAFINHRFDSLSLMSAQSPSQVTGFLK